MRSLIVIGAGYSGIAIAQSLLNAASAGCEVVLVDRTAGTAPSGRRSSLLLHAPASQLGLDDADPEDFVRHVRRRLPEAGPGSFVPRRLHREFLWARLAATARHAAARGGATLRIVGDEVRALRREGTQLAVQLSDTALHGERVVLTVGHPTPAPPRAALELVDLDDPRFVCERDEDAAFTRLDGSAPLLLVGTGLAMADTVVRLRALGVGAPLIAVSPDGGLPQAHRGRSAPPVLGTLLPARLMQQTRVRTMLADFRRESASIMADGGDWRDVVAALRPHTPQLWQRLAPAERRRFARHLRGIWERHRLRAAPAVADLVAREHTAGSLRVVAGELVSLRRDARGLRAYLRRRHQVLGADLRIGGVIDCRDPLGDVGASSDPLFRALLLDGWLRADDSRVGLDVDDTYRPRGADAAERDTLFYVGPLLRARDWEAIAAPELRRHAQRAAHLILATLHDASVQHGALREFPS